MTRRHPNDGFPYYCEVCGLGMSELLACEDTACKLEDLETAKRRQEGWIEERRIMRTAVKAGD